MPISNWSWSWLPHTPHTPQPNPDGKITCPPINPFKTPKKVPSSLLPLLPLLFASERVVLPDSRKSIIQRRKKGEPFSLEGRSSSAPASAPASSALFFPPPPPPPVSPGWLVGFFGSYTHTRGRAVCCSGVS